MTAPRNPSLWMATAAGPARPALPGDTDTDVVVIGAGIAGLSTALELKQRGHKVVVIEAGRVAEGVTGYTTAKITSLHGLAYADLLGRHGETKARLYAEANQSAIDKIGRWVETLGIDCDFTPMAAYTFTMLEQNVPALRDEVEAMHRIGLAATLEVETPLPFAVAAAVRLGAQAQFHPRKYCLALAEAIDGDGSMVVEQTRALKVQQDEQVTVLTDRGVVRGRAAVVATQLPFINTGFFFAKASPQRSYALSVAIDGPLPQGMFLSAETPVRSVRPHGAHLIVGGQSHRVGESDDHEANYEALEAWAREHFAVRSVEHRWSAQDYMPADGIPYIGRASARAHNVYVATGFKKWGMTTGTFAGDIIADLIDGVDNPWNALFDATKLNPIASARDLLVENSSVARHFVMDRIALRTARELQPGEGDVVLCDGHRVAAFRDADGTLKAVSPRCTHLGCFVRFNDAEQTWDCPCHGSRFDTDGRVIQGPAVKDLAPIDVETPAET